MKTKVLFDSHYFPIGIATYSGMKVINFVLYHYEDVEDEMLEYIVTIH